MTIITKLFYSFFTFTGSALWVSYADPSIASHSVWMIPGTYEDCE